jgi:predicted amidohydrolase
MQRSSVNPRSFISCNERENNMRLTIAFLQLLPAGSLMGNLEKGIEACRQAKEKGADIAIFPEMWSCGYVFPHDEASLREYAVSCDNVFVKRFSELAEELDMAIAVTLLEQHEPKPRNTVCLFDRHGKLQYRYSKVHICDFGEADDEGVLDAGDAFFTADLDTKDGIIKVGSMICYDREFPESARILMLKGAELLLVPNACPMELNRLAQLRGRAYENMLAIATCNYPAPHPDCNGHSTLFDGVVYLPELSGSRDTCVFEAEEGEGVYTAELDVDMLRKYRLCEVWGVKNRRPELYGEISDKGYVYDKN